MTFVIGDGQHFEKTALLSEKHFEKTAIVYIFAVCLII